MRTIIYTRISQDRMCAENQLQSLHRLAAFRQFDIIKIVEETESGAKHRPKLEALINGEEDYDVLLVWALDRLGRGGALEALNIIEKLDKRRIAVVSAQESWLDTSFNNPLRDVLIAFSATVAKMERARLIERTKAGLAVARAKGKILGKPSPLLAKNWLEIVADWKLSPTTYKDLAVRLGGVSGATAWNLANVKTTPMRVMFAA